MLAVDRENRPGSTLFPWSVQFGFDQLFQPSGRHSQAQRPAHQSAIRAAGEKLRHILPESGRLPQQADAVHKLAVWGKIIFPPCTEYRVEKPSLRIKTALEYDLLKPFQWYAVPLAVKFGKRLHVALNTFKIIIFSGSQSQVL